MKKETLREKVKRGAVATATYIHKRRNIIMPLIMLMVLSVPRIVFAGEAGEEEWSFLTGLLKTWGSRLGGVVFLYGGIEFGLGWKDNNPADKVQGGRIAIAGLIVMAVCANADKFLK